MRLVRQRGSLDCGIAVVAMLANCSYRTVESLIRTTALYPHKKRGMRAREMVTLLNELHSSWWKVTRRYRGTWLGLSMPHMTWAGPRLCAPLAALVTMPNGDQHWLGIEQVWGICYIYDPAPLGGLYTIPDGSFVVNCWVTRR